MGECLCVGSRSPEGEQTGCGGGVPTVAIDCDAQPAGCDLKMASGRSRSRRENVGGQGMGGISLLENRGKGGLVALCVYTRDQMGWLTRMWAQSPMHS